jgi:hypothetical protein
VRAARSLYHTPKDSQVYVVSIVVDAPLAALVGGREVRIGRYEVWKREWIARAMRPPLAVAAFALVVSGCGAPTTRVRAAEPPQTWVRAEMKAAALDEQPADGVATPTGDPIVLRWEVIEDGSLRVEEAIVLVNVGDDRWRLAHVYRHLDVKGPSAKWQLVKRFDTPLVSHRYFTTKPTAAEIEQFLADTEWRPLPPGFYETAGDDK